MKVAILSVTEGKGYGAEVVLMELLKAIPDGKNFITIIAPESTGIYIGAKELGYHAIPLPSSKDSLKNNIAAAFKVRRQCRKFDILHAWTARAFELLLVLKSRRGQKISGTLHDHPCANFHGSLRRLLMRFSGNHFDGMVSVSKAVATECNRSGYKKKITVIYNGLNDEHGFRPQLKKAYFGDRINMVFLGMYSPVKGFELIADYINSADASHKLDWYLYGDICSEYSHRAKSLSGLGKNVFLHGRQPSDKIFSNAGILIHTSTSFDSLPTVLIEAARSGIPSIASSLGGGNEIVDNGITGFVFDPNKDGDLMNAIEKCIGDPYALLEMGEAARKRFETGFKVASMVNEYSKFWKMLIRN